MKISPVTYSPVRNYQKTNVKNQITYTPMQQSQSPNFKGWGGALGTIGGALIGLGLAIASGGALAWAVPMASGLSGIGGDMYEKSKYPDHDD